MLLVLLLVQALTGLVLTGTDLYYPPLGPLFAACVAAPGADPATLAPGAQAGLDAAAYESMRALRKPFIVVHYYNFFLIVPAVIAHVASVVVMELREDGMLVSAMFTGRKVFSAEPVNALPGTGPYDPPSGGRRSRGGGLDSRMDRHECGRMPVGAHRLR